MTTRTLNCECKHEWQDQKYGQGKRLHNVCKDGKAWRCTVCLKEREK